MRQSAETALRKLDPSVSRETLGRLETMIETLLHWQKAINLVGRATLDDVWTRHILDSAQLIPLIPKGAKSLADLGDIGITAVVKCRGGHEKTKLGESPSSTVNWRGLQTNGKPSIADSRVVDDDSKNKGFDHETGTIVTVLTQMSLELAIASFLVKHDGIRAILTKPEKLTDDQIHEKWLDNELHTKNFEEYKKLLADKHPGTFGVFEGLVDMFQKSRNKIMHLHFRFDQDHLYDLKFESTFVLIHAVSHFLFEDEFDHSNNIASLLSGDTFSKLIHFPPYQYHVEKLAKEYSKVVLRCPMCEQVAFSDLEFKCFSCTYEDPFIKLLRCSKCSERSVIYDHLNFGINEKLPTLCQNCGDRREVFKCRSCQAPLIGGFPYLYCASCAEDAREDVKRGIGGS